MSGLAHGRIDRGGRLIEAEPPLARLQEAAGAGVGDPVAVPQIATLARLAQRLGILVSRCVIAADGADDLDLWVEARPDEQGVSLSVGGWARRPSRGGESEADRVHDLMRSRGDWLWETDADLRLTTLGAPSAEAALGAPLSRFFSFEDGDEGMPILEAVAGRARFDGQAAIVRDSGERVRLTGLPLVDGGGRFAGYRGSAFRLDLPTPEAATPDLSPLDALSARLEKALRGPLSRIVEQAETIGAQDEGPVHRDYAEYAQDIASAGRHLLGVVGDLVDLQAIERDDFRPRAEPIDLAELGRRAAALLKVRASARGIRIDAPAGRLGARGDAGRVVQILVNLIGNAIRHSPDQASIWVRGDVQGSRAVVTVADQGQGIDPADQNRIFEKFTRLDYSDGSGSGLGLYIARRLARAMGGEIDVDSAAGQGARFTLSLPAD